MNVIIYDEASMIKFVKSVRPFPVLYDPSHCYYYSRVKQNECWSLVAKQMGDDVTLCRDKWKNVKASYTRYLRRMYSGSCNSKQYYLAPYLDYLTPFINFGGLDRTNSLINKKRKLSSSATGNEIDYHVEDVTKTKIKTELPTSEVVVNIGSKNLKKKDKNSNSKSDLKLKKEQECENEVHINFFKSLLPEVERMTRKEKLSFKLHVIKTVQDILYGSDAKMQ